MSLFSNLLNLHSKKPTEDFFTEIISYFFSKNKEILEHWLRNLLVINNTSIITELYISTQAIYQPLENHSRGSRPDILIEIIFENSREIIFLESKIGSSEGENQLKNYAGILASLSGFSKAHLVYITRDFEPKISADIIKIKNHDKVLFHQARWHKLFYFLSDNYESNPLVKEILIFMKEKGMAQHNKFTSIDLLAMSNFNKVLSLMNESLNNNDVKDKFKELFDSVSQEGSSLTQLKNNNRYILFSKGSLWCGVGYFNVGSDGIEGTPDFGVIIEVSPGDDQREEVINMMLGIVKNRGSIWKENNLGDSKAWSSIFYTKNLQEVLSDSDHVLTIKSFFLECLSEIEKIKKEYNELTWS